MYFNVTSLDWPLKPRIWRGENTRTFYLDIGRWQVQVGGRR